MHAHVSKVQVDLASFDPGEVQQLVDHPRESLDIGFDPVQVIGLPLGEGPSQSIENVIHVALDRGHRRSELVRHGRDEIRLELVQLLEPPVGFQEKLRPVLDPLLQRLREVFELLIGPGVVERHRDGAGDGDQQIQVLLRAPLGTPGRADIAKDVLFAFQRGADNGDDARLSDRFEVEGRQP